MEVVSVGYAAVKGTRHTARESVALGPAGLVGDRAHCAVDVERGHVLRTVQNPALLALASCVDGDGVLRLTTPGGAVAEGPAEPTGETLTCEYWGRPVPLRLLDGPHAALVSDHLGRPVRLAAAPPGGVVYGGAVTLVTGASLRAVVERLGHAPEALDPARFRANAVLDCEGPAFAEESWVGREVDLGAARVQVTGLVPRCAVVDLGPATGERDLPVLRALVALAQERGADGRDGPPFAVEARVVRPGAVRPGDAATVLA